MRRLRFYYDVVCPFAYLASTQIEALAARAGVELVWRPILLGGVFRAIGSPDRPGEAMGPNRARLNRADMQRYAALYGVRLALPAGHPRRTVEAMRLCHTVDGAARVALTHALYRAYFAEGRDLADRAVLADLAATAGADVAGIDEPAIKDALRAATDEAVRAGAFGVPTFVVESAPGGGERLFWGQDRMHLVERALA